MKSGSAVTMVRASSVSHAQDLVMRKRVLQRSILAASANPPPAELRPGSSGDPGGGRALDGDATLRLEDLARVDCRAVLALKTEHELPGGGRRGGRGWRRRLPLRRASRAWLAARRPGAARPLAWFPHGSHWRLVLRLLRRCGGHGRLAGRLLRTGTAVMGSSLKAFALVRSNGRLAHGLLRWRGRAARNGFCADAGAGGGSTAGFAWAGRPEPSAGFDAATAGAAGEAGGQSRALPPTAGAFAAAVPGGGGGRRRDVLRSCPIP